MNIDINHRHSYIETMVPDFFDHDAIRPQPYRIYRVNAKGKRFYFTWEDRTRDPQIYFSVTTFNKQTAEESKYLARWRGTLGNYLADMHLNMSAKYGTLMHIEIGKFCRNREYDFSYENIASVVDSYFAEHRIEPFQTCILNKDGNDATNRQLFIKRLKRDLMSFHQWWIDHNFKPLAMELVLKGSEGYATALDLVGYLDIDVADNHGEVYKSGAKAGLPKVSKQKRRILGVIDFKSGEHFYDNHAKQLVACKRLWNENYPDKPCDKIFNWSPKAWKGTATPTYNFKDQSEAVDDEEFDALVNLGRVRIKKAIQMETITDTTEGVLKLGKSDEKAVRRFNLVDYIKEVWANRGSRDTDSGMGVTVSGGEKAMSVPVVRDVPDFLKPKDADVIPEPTVYGPGKDNYGADSGKLDDATLEAITDGITDNPEAPNNEVPWVEEEVTEGKAESGSGESVQDIGTEPKKDDDNPLAFLMNNSGRLF